jgi:AcrR family transcriptional regulator
MSAKSAGPGLRQRNRLATRRAIQYAVLTLSLERGIEKVTVADISRLARISPRTFFNYFPSKDAALVGEAPGLASADDIERFVNGSGDGDILAQLARLLAVSLERVDDDRRIHQLRRAVLKDNTHLFGMRVATLRDFEERLQVVVERRLVADHPNLAGDPEVLSDRALLLTLISVAAMRHAWRCWAESAGDAPLSAQIEASFREVYDITRKTG